MKMRNEIFDFILTDLFVCNKTEICEENSTCIHFGESFQQTHTFACALHSPVSYAAPLHTSFSHFVSDGLHVIPVKKKNFS